MLKKIIGLTSGRSTYLLIAILIALNANAQNYGNFPYEESFKSAGQPFQISIPSVSSGVNSARFTDAGLRLTNAEQSQFGAIFINSLRFKTINGIIIEFEYMIYGGEAVNNADGFSLFLFDAAISNPTIGTKGFGLGYTFNRAIDRYMSARAPGLTGGYLGIGFDNFGNFKSVRFQGESRVNGLSDGNILGKSNVTLRGAKGEADPNYKGANTDGYSGYPVLISQSTLSPSLNRKINASNGAYNSFTSSFDASEAFSLRGGASFSDKQTSNTAYRKAIVELYPWVENNIVLGKLVTVKIQVGAKFITVIQNFQYPEELTYIENSYSTLASGDLSTSDGTAKNAPKKLNTKAPEYVRVGFAASTGAYYDNHYIKNLKITLPSAAIAVDDEIQTPINQLIDIHPLTNDIGFTGPIKPGQKGNSSYLNPSFFRFIDSTGNPVNGYSYTSSEGIWIYNPSTGIVTFTPAVNYLGKATIKYDIKAGLNNEEPYIDDAYRSLTATITVLVTPPQAIVTNLMLQPLIR